MQVNNFDLMNETHVIPIYLKQTIFFFILFSEAFFFSIVLILKLFHVDFNVLWLDYLDGLAISVGKAIFNIHSNS